MRQLDTSIFAFVRPAVVLAKLVGLGALASACAPGAVDEPQQSESPKVAKATEAIAGIDLDATISTASQQVNRYATLAANASAGATSINVSAIGSLTDPSNGALGTGDLVMLMQMQGATISTTNDVTWGNVTSLNGAGNYELVEVLSVSGNTITLSCGLKNAYTTAGVTQVVRVPQYNNLTVSSGGSIVAPAWNGATGGVVAIHVQNAVSLSGSINVSSLGFRGGAVDDVSGGAGTDYTIYTSTSNADGALKGEGIAGLRTEYGRGAAANGGGGGNAHNGGGGGGANGRPSGSWTGQGVFDLTVMGGATAWLLDPNYSATASIGGGRGGYTYSSSNQNALLLAPGQGAWGGNDRRQRGGLGGRPVDNDPANRLYLGGGGGAGDGNNGHAGRGGNGGGIVILIAGSVSGTGQILANGEAGATANSSTGSASGDAPGGGGAGGSVLVQASTVTGISVQARGGVGGNQVINNGDECEGPGGGGGGGYVFASSTITADVAGAASGTTNCPPINEFPVNGATRGNTGQTVFGPAATLPYCADTTGPDTTINTNPTNPTNDTTGDFTFSSPEVTATFECRVDGGSFAACTSPFATAALAQGSHTFEVRARDTLGNVDATPASYTWVVDTTAPDTTIDTNPANPTNDPTGDFTFSSADVTATFECRVDGGAFAPCTSPFTTPALGEGSHTLEVRARDAAGNVDATPASYTWVIDATAPDTAIVTSPANPTNDTTGDFTFSSADVTATFECRVDGGAFAPCTSPFTTPVLGEGSHTLEVRARDAAGNVDATPASYTWVIDATAPDTAIVTSPANPTNDTTGDFTFSSADMTATFECRVDGDAFAPCTSPFTAAALGDGSHTFEVRARDAAGNVDATPASVTWVIDTTAPDTAIDSGPADPTNDTTGDFTFSSADVTATFECRVDGDAFAPCTSSFTTAALGEGPHTFEVRARDTAGNVDPTPALFSWEIDLTPPGVAIVTRPDATTTDTTPEFTFNSPDATATLECRLDSDPFVACTSPLVTSALPLGSHTFEVQARDPAGNVTPVPESWVFTIVGVDTDGDGLSDEDEDAIGTDPRDADSDDDGLPDGLEVDVGVDTDGDGLINGLDPDSDDDGLFDGTEMGRECQGAGIDLGRGFCRSDADNGLTTTSPVNPDTDGGGASDGSEDANLDGAVDPGETNPTTGNGSDDSTVVDTDGDGLGDALEETLGSDPNDVDSDDDGLLDGDEPNPSADGDGDGLVNVLDVDSDDDGLFDGTETGRDCTSPDTEVALGHCRADGDAGATVTSAVNPDTDGGGARDGSEDADLDGAIDVGETDPTVGHEADDGTVVDTDGDGLSDATEDTIGTDPNDVDSDDDGVPDGEEPNPSDDHDGDGDPNALDPDSDDDGLFDGTETGRGCSDPDTDPSAAQCIADGDGGDTTTGVLDPDTDDGGVLDGTEDADHDGVVDAGETDPNDPLDDDTGGGAGGAGGEGGGPGSGGAGAVGGSGEGGTGVGGEGGLGPSGAGGEGGSAIAGEGGGPSAGGAGGADSGGEGGASEGGAAGEDGEGGDAGSGAATGGTAGTSGSAGTGGTAGTGGSAGTAGTAGASTTGDDTNVLGGGFCAFKPAAAKSYFGLAAFLGVALSWLRRRRR